MTPFQPSRFDPNAWARLAKVSGIRYLVFTTKHHSGFTMFDSATTEFGVMNTPFARDVTRELVEAFRAQGIAVGFYFSPDDFHFLYRQGTLISRRRAEAQPVNNPPLMKHNQAQVRELLSNYGVRPWVRSNEGNIWFTRKRGTNTVFAILVTDSWNFGERKEFVLTSVVAGPETNVSVFGQSDQVLEYQPDVIPETRWRQAEDGLHISVVRAQRLYNDRTWPNPVVLKITDAGTPDD